MKSNLKTIFFVCVALLMGFASCNDENNVNGETDIDKGDPTSVAIHLNFPKPETSQLRSTNDDPYATEAEVKISTVDVFIYATDKGYYLSHTSLTGSDFTQVASGDNSTQYVFSSPAKIATTTGKRTVFVGINLPPDVVTALEHKGTSELTQVAKTLTRSQLVSVNGIAMTNTTLNNYTFVKEESDPANNLEITVKRMVAKVTVQKGNPMIQAGVPGKLGSLSFGINNFNERSYFIQDPAPGSKDPNWDRYDASEFSQINYQNAYYQLVGDSLISDPKKLNALYAAENTAKTHTKREITRATIRATFIPDTIIVYRNSDYVAVTSASEGITTPRTFWTVTLYRPNPEMKFFYNENNAKNYAAANGLTAADVVTYTNGLCYWDLFLNKDVWDVFRNDYYRSTITRIVAPGRSTEEIPDDDLDDEPSSETNITFDLEVLDWISITGEYELEP